MDVVDPTVSVINEIEKYDVWEVIKRGCVEAICNGAVFCPDPNVDVSIVVRGLFEIRGDCSDVLCSDVTFVVDGDYNLGVVLKYLEDNGYKYVGDKGTFESYEKVMGTVTVNGVKYNVVKEVDIDKRTLYIIIATRLRK